MDPAGKSQAGVAAEKPRLPVAGIIELRLESHKGRDRVWIEKFGNGPVARRVQALVGIDIKYPVGGNFLEPPIARSREVVIPFEMEDARAERPSDGQRVID